MGDSSSSEGLAAEAVELSEGMLGIIGAYGMAARADVGNVQLKAAKPSPARERVLVSAAGNTSAGLRTRADG
jgi:hypothetical protein